MRAIALLTVLLPAAALAQTPPPSQTDKPPVARDDKVICKSFAEVGSLIATKKECKTRREWDAESAATQHHLADCVNTGAATGSHC